MALSIEQSDLVFFDQHFNFQAFLKDDYDGIFSTEWKNQEIPCINFKDISSEEVRLINELLEKSNSCYLSYFPVKEGLPKYYVATQEDVIYFIDNDVFNWFEPLVIFSDCFILINEPDLDKCFVSFR